MAKQEQEMDITFEELEKIKNAMKNEEFRKMFVDYANEISDPENRKKYEAEIAQMEAERGMDVKFVNPQDGFVVKTSIRREGGKKIFINICQSDVIAAATSTFVEKKTNSERSGHQWSIPYSLNQPKDDTDKAGKRCTVCDVVFNPKTYEMGIEDARFKKLIIDTALEAIEREWKMKLDHKNLKFPKVKFKGTKQATVIRNPDPNNQGTKEPGDDIEIGNHKLPYPYKTAEKQAGEHSSGTQTGIKPDKPDSTPEYSIVHRGHLDLQNFTNARDCRASTRPKELLVNIELPLCKSSAGVDLEIFEKQLVLDSSDPPYHLDISLPYSVIESEGNAKFDKSKRRLTVTLPVQPSLPCEMNRDLEPVGTVAATTENHSTADEAGDESGENCERDSGTLGSGADSVCVHVEGITGDNCGQAGETLNEPEVDDGGTEDIKGRSVYRDINDKISDISCPFFNTPTYSYHQDSQTVTFVLHVPDVSIDTVSLGFNANTCSISFPSSLSSPPSLASPGYALYIQFPEHCIIDGDSSKIDSNDQNLVLILYKERAETWHCFLIGSREEKLEKKLFLTETNLCESLERNEDNWTGGSARITSHKVEKISEELSIKLEVEKELEKMGNYLGWEAENTHEEGETNFGTTDAKSEKIISAGRGQTPGEVVKNCGNGALIAGGGVQVSGGTVQTVKDWVRPSRGGVKNLVGQKPEDGVESPTGEKTPEAGFVLVGPGVEHDLVECDEIEEVEVVEDAYGDETPGLSTVQEVESNTGPVSTAADLQRARVIKCKKNRRRRRRSTGSHESSSISEEEGENGRNLRGKHARKLRKSRSLSFGSSTESHDDAEYGSLDGARSVRFNLVPEVRVFSNKADKRKWKELRKQGDTIYSGSWPAGGHSPSKSALKETNGFTSLNINRARKNDDLHSPRDDDDDDDEPDVSGLQDKFTACKLADGDRKPCLTNALIFDLDD